MSENKLQVELTGDSSGLLGAISKGLEGLKGFAEGVKTHMETSSKETGKYSGTVETLEKKVVALREKWLELKAAQTSGKGGDLIGAEVKNAERALKGASNELANFKIHSTAAAKETNHLQNAIGGISTVAPEAGSILSSFAGGPLVVVAAGLVAAIGAGVAFVEFLDRAVNHATAFDEEMGKSAEKIGLTSEAISGLVYAAKLLDVEQQQLMVGMGKFEKSVYEAIDQPTSIAAKALRKLGLEGPALTDALRDPQTAMETLSEHFAGMQNDGAKTALAMEIFGRSGKELIPMLNAGAEKLRAAREEAKQFGLVTSGPAAEAAEHLSQNTKRLHGFLEGLELQVGRTLIPVLGDLTDDLLGVAKDGADPLSLGIKALGDGLIQGVSQIRLIIVEVESFAHKLSALGDLLAAFQEAEQTLNFSKVADSWHRYAEAITQDDIASHIKKQVIIAQDSLRRFQLWQADQENAPKKKSALDLGNDGNGSVGAGQLMEAMYTSKMEAEEKKRHDIRQKGYDSLRKLTEVYNQGEATAHEQQLAHEEKLAGERVKNGEITNAQYILKMKAFEEEKYQIALKALKEQAILEDSEPIKALETWNKIEQLAQAHGYRMEEIEKHTVHTAQQHATSLDTVVKTLQTGFGTAFAGMVTGAQTFTQAIGGFFRNLASTVVNAIGQMISRTLLYKAVTLAANHGIITSETAKRMATLLGVQADTAATAATTTKTAANAASIGPNVGNAASQTFATHAGIPIVGAIIAAALVLVMLATMSKVKGRAVGGVVGEKGPELTMLGEKGLEVVAPEHDFKDWARGLVGMGANLGANLTYHRASVEALNRTAAGYANAPLRDQAPAQEQSQGGHTIHVNLSGATILDSSEHGMRKLGRLVMDASMAAGRERGVVLQPGDMYGRLS